jgi:hypothetical protein
MDLGVFMGADRNAEEDSLPLAAFDWRWGQELLALQLAGHGTDFGNWASSVPAEAEQMFIRAVRAHGGGGLARWGWKHPHSYLLLPFLHRMIPNLTFVQVVRDGRDIALSSNQRQLSQYGELLLGQSSAATSAADRSAAFWSMANCLSADYAETHLGQNYLLLRLEEICADPASALSGLARLLRLSPACYSRDNRIPACHGIIAVPTSLGRWRHEPPDRIMALEQAGRPGLVRFGYCGDALARPAAEHRPAGSAVGASTKGG